MSKVSRLLIGTPTTGLVRIEWVIARYSQVTPVNWSETTYNWIVPVGYSVADAQNMVAKYAVEQEYEWLLFVEHDVVLPRDAFVRFNTYMSEGKVPVVSGLYYTRTSPPTPMIFRGRGTGYFGGWEHGDQVWCDGVPTGCLLVHGSILKAMWDDSPEYEVGGSATRQVFESPRRMTEHGIWSGTSDLEWCSRVMDGGYFAQAGWDKYQEMENPLLVDTNIFCRHISTNGEQFP